MYGTMVISLDFELMWGVLERRTIIGYGENILGGRSSIPDILTLFKKYGIHATWGVVGLLYLQGFQDMEHTLPNQLPLYENERLSSYFYLESIKNLNEKYFFANNIIDEIASHAGQEIATHTFSHYYCRENGQNAPSFKADIEHAVRTAAKHGYATKSIIFPRNQLNEDYISILQKNGIQNYRGNESGFAYRPCRQANNSLLRRGVRLLDTYANLSGYHCYAYSDIPQKGMNNIRSSRFLRPYNRKLFFLEPLKIHRIKMQMRYAAKHGTVFHLWWHPHNFGKNTKENMTILEKLLKYFKILEKRYGFQSQNMKEVGDFCNGCINAGWSRRK